MCSFPPEGALYHQFYICRHIVVKTKRSKGDQKLKVRDELTIEGLQISSKASLKYYAGRSVCDGNKEK